MRPVHQILTAGGTLPRRLRSAWIVVLALSPLAYFGATMLESQLPHERKFASIGKDRAIEIARVFGRSMGVDTTGWFPGVSAESHSSISAVFRKFRPASLERLFAPATLQVTLTSQDHRWLHVQMIPDGRIVGFSASKPPKGEPPDEAAARAIAESFLRRQLGPEEFSRLKNFSTHGRGKQAWEREFQWESDVPELNATKIIFHAGVAGDKIVSHSVTLQLDAATKRLIGSTKVLDIIFGIACALIVMATGVYAIVRYVQRSVEREISHRRTLLVAVLFATCGTMALVVNGAGTSVNVNGQPSAGGIATTIFLTIGLGFLGVILGVAYGAGEGDLREAYPGKLVSIDAFLCANWLSANCARSILAGGAFAGWLLLVKNALLLAGRGAPIGNYASLVNNAMQRAPLLQTVNDLAPVITMCSVFGLMLPLTFLRSRIRRDWIVYAALVGVSMLVAYNNAPDALTWQDSLVQTVIWTAATCAPFFFGDLLAALSSIAALSFVDVLLRKSAVSEQWHTIAYSHVLPAGILFLLIELYCAWRGRVYDEAEVRPLYARHLVQRLAMTAEIGAARLAQMRLLPDASPDVAGLSVAGSCIPAREVGGDFFDYYVLDDHRLGVFLAEGGSRELGSAMAIALAKGFLMYTARLDLTPVEILRRLRSTLGAVLLGENASMTVLYAVVDGASGSVRYARAGTSPRVVLNGRALAEEIVTDRADGFAIRHGAATLEPRDALFFYTDGWAGQIADRTRKAPDLFLRDLSRKLPDAAAEALHKAAVDAAMKRTRNAPADDVTAVVVRREEAVATAIGGIA